LLRKTRASSPSSASFSGPYDAMAATWKSSRASRVLVHLASTTFHDIPL
jgi:hypothetical protein